MSRIFQFKILVFRILDLNIKIRRRSLEITNFYSFCIVEFTKYIFFSGITEFSRFYKISSKYNRLCSDTKFLHRFNPIIREEESIIGLL